MAPAIRRMRKYRKPPVVLLRKLPVCIRFNTPRAPCTAPPPLDRFNEIYLAFDNVFANVIFIRKVLMYCRLRDDISILRLFRYGHNLLVRLLWYANVLVAYAEMYPNNARQSRLVSASIADLADIDLRGGRGMLPLQLACGGCCRLVDSSRLLVVPCSPNLVVHMLRAGASPDAPDLDWNTALHEACMSEPLIDSVIRSLLLYGAHADYANRDGETPDDLLRESGRSISEFGHPLRLTNLQCIAARAINKYNIPYETVLPLDLHLFVRRHTG